MREQIAFFSGQYQKTVLSRSVHVSTKECRRVLMRGLQGVLRDSNGKLRKDVESIRLEIDGVECNFQVPSKGDRIKLPSPLRNTIKTKTYKKWFGLVEKTETYTVPATHYIKITIKYSSLEGVKYG